MTPGYDELDQQLRATLRREADALPGAGDQAGPAIGRARTIRRRRRTAAAAAVVAVVAIAVPVGLEASDSDPRTTPAPPAVEPTGKVELELALPELPSGSAPGTPWADGAAYRVGDTTYPLPPERMGITRSEAGAVFVSAPDYMATLVTEDGAVTSLQPEGTDLDDVASSSTGSHTAIVYSGAAPDGERTLAVLDAATGETSSHPLGVSGPVQVVTVGTDGVVLMQPGSGAASKPTLRFDGATVQQIDAAGVTAWSPAIDRYASIIKVTDFGSCSALLRGREAFWRTCDWQVSSFSPDGRWAYATPAYADGYGPTRVAVLDVLTGELVRELSLDSGERFIGVFRDAVWESADALLLRAESQGQTALVRLDVLTGEVELATDPVRYGGIESGQPPPYLLG